MATVKRIEKFGAFCEIFPGKDGLLHISEIQEERTKEVEDVLKLGDQIFVKVIEIDNQGRVNLSRKVVIKEEKERAEQANNNRETRFSPKSAKIGFFYFPVSPKFN